jgi:anti-sigma-K factor RskA
MISEPTPFDHRPDPVLGSALRRALSPDEQAAFVARVMAALDSARAAHWDVLASWARAGIAAAAIAVLLGGLLVGRTRLTPASIDDVLTLAAGPSAPVLVGASSPPDPSVVLSSPEVR